MDMLNDLFDTEDWVLAFLYIFKEFVIYDTSVQKVTGYNLWRDNIINAQEYSFSNE